jgi:hypothetical protein
VFLTHFLSLAVPSIRYWFWPRFGDVAPLSLLPLVHLISYLWRPSPKRLKGAAFMLFAIVAIVAAKIALVGPVPALPNGLSDRLPFAYLFSMFTVAAMGVYVGWVAWSCRFQVALEIDSVQNRG